MFPIETRMLLLSLEAPLDFLDFTPNLEIVMILIWSSLNEYVVSSLIVLARKPGQFLG